MDVLPEDSEDLEDHQEKTDYYEELLSSLEEAKGLIEDIALEP
jgi:hypothetical protein